MKHHSLFIRRWDRGITLLESLIAIIVLSLGVLGILGSQIKTLSNTQETNYRTEALKLIDDLSDLMKIQPDAVAMKSLYTTDGGGNTAQDECQDTECSPQDLAKSDFSKWNRKVANFLPLGEATVFETQDEKQIGVLIQWRSSSDNDKINTLITESLKNKNGASIECEEGYACHFQFISLIQRCIEENNIYYCAEN